MRETVMAESNRGHEGRNLPEKPLGVNGEAERAGLPGPLQLAYLGDAVWELHVRSSVLRRGGGTPQAIHRRAVRRVRAGAQADALHRIEPLLTDEERHVARRGRNAKNSVPRGVEPREYRHSTAFECLLGFLYFTGRRERLREVLEMADDAMAARAERGERRESGSFGPPGTEPETDGEEATT